MWLVVLAVLPFTAPFAAFDLADLTGGAHTGQVTATISAGVVASSQSDDADDVSASDSSVHRVHPTGLCQLVPAASPAAGDPVIPLVAVIDPATSTSPTPDDVSALVVTLRL